MNVAAQGPLVTGIFHQERFVPALVQMPDALISFRVPIGVTREPVLHPASEVWLRSLDQRMDAIGHPAKGQDDPAAPLDFVLKSLGKPLVVPRVMKKFAATISTGDNVVIGPKEIEYAEVAASD